MPCKIVKLLLVLAYFLLPNSNNAESSFETDGLFYLNAVEEAPKSCIELDILPKNPSCAGGNNGSITINILGGSPDYTIFWNGPGTGLPNNGSVNNLPFGAYTITNLTAGSFEIFVFDGKKCEATASIKLSNPPAFSYTAIMSDPACIGTNNGSIKIFDFVNGSPLYTVQWDGPGANDGVVDNVNGDYVIFGLAAGSYDIRVTDTKACEYIVKDVLVTSTSGPSVNITGDTEFCPDQSNGTLSVSTSGIVNISWSTGSTSATTIIPSAGTYSVTVTSGNGCTASDQVTVSQIPAIDIVLEAGSSQLIESCAGDCDGSIDITVLGGAGSVASYSWTGTGSYTSGMQDISGLCTGTYQLTITDVAGCTETFQQNISSPPAFLASLDPNAVSCASNNDGSIDVSWSGGVGPYVVTWDGPGTGSPNNGTQTGINSFNFTIPDLNAGTFIVEVKDDAGCLISESVVISSGGAFSFTAVEGSNSCSGTSTGSILVSNYASGVAPYDISWAGPSSGIQSNDPGDYTITGLASGSYTITVVDDNGCSSVVSGVIVTESSKVDVDIVGDIVFCNEQAIGTLSTVPNTFATYSWSTGSSSSSISVTNPGVGSTTYSVSVTDSGGCTGSTSINVQGLAPINISLNTSNSDLESGCGSACDGSLSIDVSGGTGIDYSYSWQGPSGFLSANKNISNLCAGQYNLTVVDNNGCSASFSREISASADIDVSAIPTATSCFGASDGSISLNLSGGVMPYHFLWSNGETSQNIVGLDGGTYSVTINDSNGCMTTAMATVGESSDINATISPISSEICAGEEVTLVATGGDTYLWSNGFTSSSITVYPTESTTFEVEIGLNGNSCTKILQASVIVQGGPNGSILINENSGSANNDGEICEGRQVTLTATGGTSYTWTGGVANPLVVSPSPGISTYSVTVSNGSGCATVLTQDITVNENPNAQIDFSNANQTIQEPQSLVNSSTANCGSLVSCSWTVEGSLYDSDCADINPSFDSQGTKEIKLQVSNSCGCSDEISSSIDIVPANSCVVQEFSLNGSFPDACVGETVSLVALNSPSIGCQIIEERIDVMLNGLSTNSYVLDDDEIVFTEVGVYTLISTFEDNCSCSREAVREINIVPMPQVGFADVNILSGCLGDIIKINFADYDLGEKVTIRGLGNSDQVYETSNFNLALTEVGVNTIEIISVRNSNCESMVVNESVDIETFAPVELISINRNCDDLGLKYILEVEIAGGDESATIDFEGPDTIDFSFAGNKIFVRDLYPDQSYSFKVNRGILCDDVLIDIDPFSCECVFNAGTSIDTFFIGCQGEFFDVSTVFNASAVFSAVTDTLFLALHDIEDDISLGNVVATYPYNTSFISNNFKDFIPSKQYFLSLVGIRKFELQNINLNDYQSLSLLGRDDCLSVIAGVPMKWHGSDVNISGPSIVCENAYNEIFISSGIGAGAELDIDIQGLTPENYTFDDANNRLYVHFVNEDEEMIPITIAATSFHVDSVKGRRIETECFSAIEYNVQIDRSHIAPDTSNVILWPGNIYASTDTLEGICYRWGWTKVSADGFEDEYFENGDERFYFATENQVEGLSERRQIWVETYFCDDDACATRNIFNGDFPIGSQEGDIKSPIITISPNPTIEDLNLQISNLYLGKVQISVYDILGRQFYKDNWTKNGFIANKNLNLAAVPKGIYFVKVDLGPTFSKTIKLSKI